MSIQILSPIKVFGIKLIKDFDILFISNAYRTYINSWEPIFTYLPVPNLDEGPNPGIAVPLQLDTGEYTYA